MVVVALAGASTGLGASILKEIVATKKHNVILLSRGENAAISALGVDVRPVDYKSHASLVAALKGVHTLLSVIGSFDPAVMTDGQLALLAAAKEAGVKRFSASDYAMPSYEGLDAYAVKIPVWEAAKKSGLEVTRFSPGLFMNIFGANTPKSKEEAASGLMPGTFIVNAKAGTIDMPGDGNQKLTFTHKSDVGRFVAAALDLPVWQEDMEMVGDTKTFREAIEILERVQKRKFLVKENSIEQLQKLAENPAARFYHQCLIIIAEGKLAVKPTLNGLCPQVKPSTLEQYIEKWWGGVDLPESEWEEPSPSGQSVRGQ